MTRIGVALHEGGLVVARGASVTRHDWDADALRTALAAEDAAGVAAVVRDAVAAVRAGRRDGRMVVALMPPLAQVRSVELPPMRADEARQVLARDASRYFIGVRGTQAVSLLAPRAAGAIPVAGAAPDALVDGIRRAALDAGWRAVDIVPAHAAWAAAAQGGDAIVVIEGASSTVMPLEEGLPVQVRRVRGHDAERTAAALGAHAARRVVVAGSDDAAPSLAAALGASLGGARVEVHRTVDATVLAARHAADARSLTLEARAAGTEREARLRRATRALVAAAVLLALAAAALVSWGERRELAAVRAARARIATRAQAALDRDAAARGRRELVAAVAGVSSATTVSSELVARVVTEVPADARLLSLRVAGDTLALEGLAPRAADVLRALGASPRLAQVRPVGAFRRQRVGDEAGAEELERFTLEARVAVPRDEVP